MDDCMENPQEKTCRVQQQVSIYWTRTVWTTSKYNQMYFFGIVLIPVFQATILAGCVIVNVKRCLLFIVY